MSPETSPGFVDVERGGTLARLPSPMLVACCCPAATALDSEEKDVALTSTDVVEIVLAEDGQPRFELIRDAFPLSAPYRY